MRDRVVQIESSSFDHLDRLSKHLILKAGTSYIQLFGGDQELIDFRRSGGEAHCDDAAGISGSLKKQHQRIFYTGGIDRDGSTSSVRVFQNLCLKILGCDIDGVFCTMLACFRQLVIHNVSDNDVIADCVSNLEHCATECTCAVDQKHIVRAQLSACARLNCDCGRLDHDGILIGKRIRQEIAVGFRDSDEFPITTVNVNASDFQIVADISTFSHAGIAVTATGYLIDDYTVTDFQMSDPCTDLCNDTDHLVSDNSRIGSSCVRSMVDTDIRTADTGSGHSHQNVVFAGENRLFNIDYF